VPDAPLLDQLVGVEVRRAYPAQQALLGGDDSLRCRRELARDLAWDEQHAVLVGVNVLVAVNVDVGVGVLLAVGVNVGVAVGDVPASNAPMSQRGPKTRGKPAPR